MMTASINKVTRVAKRFIPLCLFVLLALNASATRPRGGWHVHTLPDGTKVSVALRGDASFHYYESAEGQCYMAAEDGTLVPVGTLQLTQARARAKVRAQLPSLKTDWDSTRIYRQAVVLVSFADTDFSTDDPVSVYHRMLNEHGYNEGKGLGCVADYFRDQSGGLFNIQFDVFGPYKASGNARSYASTAPSLFREAVLSTITTSGQDFSVYDWDGNGVVEQVVIIYAGYGANDGTDASAGSIWPHTSSFSAISCNDGELRLMNYSASAERWGNDKLCGIGTICHEFSHSLGLPDIYPVDSSTDEYSVVDEWDLMDGGNFVNNGWCPPNYSMTEKMLLGWAHPVELTDTTIVRDMLPVSEGGVVYQVKYDDHEYSLLENRQWSGWDARLPGHGLLIVHVDYSPSMWKNNRVNNDANHHRYDIFHADNRTYNDWDLIVGEGSSKVGGHSRYLSGSPYPYVNEEEGISNNELTDESVPAALVFGEAGFMSRPIFNVRESADGTISFGFLTDVDPDASAILPTEWQTVSDSLQRPACDLLGRPATHSRLQVKQGRKIIVSK